MSKVKGEKVEGSRGYRPFIVELDHNLLPTLIRNDLRGIALLAILGLYPDRYSQVEGTFSYLRLPEFPLRPLTDRNGKINPIRSKPTRQDLETQISGLSDDQLKDLITNRTSNVPGSSSTESTEKPRKEFSADEKTFAPAKLSYLFAMLEGNWEMALQIALETFLPYYYQSGQLPKDKSGKNKLQKSLQAVLSLPQDKVHGIIMRRMIGHIGPISKETRSQLETFHQAASNFNYAPTGQNEKNALRPKKLPQSIKTLIRIIEGSELDPNLFFNLISGGEERRYDSEIDSHLRKKRIQVFTRTASESLIPLAIIEASAAYGAANLVNLLREGGIREDLISTFGFLGLVAMGLLGLKSTKALSDYYRKIAKQAEKAMPLARDAGLAKIRDMGELIRHLQSAALDLFDRREFKKYTPKSLASIYRGGIANFFANFGLTNLLQEDGSLKKLVDLNPANDRKEEDINRYLNEMLLLGDDGSPVCLSEAMVRAAVMEWIRETALRPDELKVNLPSPDEFNESTLKLGQTRLVMVKKRSTSDPLVAISIALPGSLRFLYPEFAVDKALDHESGWRDAVSFGSRIRDAQAGNLGNSGILPYVLRNFWQILRRNFPQSYIDSTINSFGKAVGTGEVSKVRNLLSEVISSQLFIQALPSILFFAYDSDVSGPQGSGKHFLKAFNNGIMGDLQEPDKFFLALSIISGLNFNIRLAEGFRKLYPDYASVFAGSIINMKQNLRDISENIFKFFFKDKAGFVSKTENEAEKSLLAKQFTMFISWIAKENPEILNDFTGEIESLCSRSGEMGENHAPSITTFFALYFVTNILKPENGREFNKYGIPTRTTEKFFKAVVGHLHKRASDLIETNLRLDSPNVNDLSYENLRNAQKFIEDGLSVFEEEQLNSLAAILNQTILTEIQKVGSKFSDFSDDKGQMLYYRFKWDKLIEIADSFLNKGILTKELRETIDCLRQEIEKHSETKIVSKALAGRVFKK